MKKKTFKNYSNFEYISVTNVPLTKKGQYEVIDADIGEIDAKVAIEILKANVRFRGKEIKFLRKTLGLSLESLANQIDLTKGAIQRWEKEAETFISPNNERILRAFFCDKYKVKLPTRFKDFLGSESYSSLKVSAV